MTARGVSAERKAKESCVPLAHQPAWRSWSFNCVCLRVQPASLLPLPNSNSRRHICFRMSCIVLLGLSRLE